MQRTRLYEKLEQLPTGPLDDTTVPTARAQTCSALGVPDIPCARFLFALNAGDFVVIVVKMLQAMGTLAQWLTKLLGRLFGAAEQRAIEPAKVC